ncbi:AraC family transcriptional regulator [Bowmanella dokdonensis]|uniref:AraC family transcriptional regulator ligand-binding domain-containing protein n=1 Tax=Bowmanella dokdonensis TaxID=751969 RepID=A0A939DQ18_9ALTE|nr:AraC family transcriptional regulator [Bowmanella dokdonensis]MBN7826685.1 AraC family transcriptional regulator ligand-binding domain-containing protein [Bowmanella dokdonensis]
MQYASLDDKFLPPLQLTLPLLDLAVRRGVDRNRLLRGTGIFIEDIRDNGTRLSVAQVLKLIANIRKLVPGHDTAFQLGRRLFPGSLGAAANLFLHSRDLEQALRLLDLFRMQICPFVHGRYHQHAGRCYILPSDAIGCGEQFQFVIEAYFTALVSAVRLVTGKRIPFQFDFPYPRPRHIQEYEENLGFRCRFSQPQLSIGFDLVHLQTPFLHPSQILVRHAFHQARMQRGELKRGFIETVRQQIARSRNLPLQNLAVRFEVSPATFKRHLKQHGFCFQQLQDEVGRQQALYLLGVKKCNNEQIASQLHFTDTTNFRRAFKRWTGCTPNELRLRLHPWSS